MSDLDFSPEDLSEAFHKQSGRFSYYAAKHAQAERQEARVKLNIDMVEATLDTQIRRKAKNEKEKLTETQITRMITLSPKYQEAVNDHIDAKQISSVCKSVAESFRQRRDMLIQLGADQREEKKGVLRMKESPSERAHKMFGSKSNETDAQKQT